MKYCRDAISNFFPINRWEIRVHVYGYNCSYSIYLKARDWYVLQLVLARCRLADSCGYEQVARASLLLEVVNVVLTENCWMHFGLHLKLCQYLENALVYLLLISSPGGTYCGCIQIKLKKDVIEFLIFFWVIDDHTFIVCGHVMRHLELMALIILLAKTARALVNSMMPEMWSEISKTVNSFKEIFRRGFL